MKRSSLVLFGEIATHLTCPRNDISAKGLLFLYRDFTGFLDEVVPTHFYQVLFLETGERSGWLTEKFSRGGGPEGMGEKANGFERCLIEGDI